MCPTKNTKPHKICQTDDVSDKIENKMQDMFNREDVWTQLQHLSVLSGFLLSPRYSTPHFELTWHPTSKNSTELTLHEINSNHIRIVWVMLTLL